jgi:hypothetical protein
MSLPVIWEEVAIPMGGAAWAGMIMPDPGGRGNWILVLD